MTEMEISLFGLVAIQFVMSICLFVMIVCVNKKFKILAMYVELTESSEAQAQGVDLLVHGNEQRDQDGQ